MRRTTAGNGMTTGSMAGDFLAGTVQSGFGMATSTDWHGDFSLLHDETTDEGKIAYIETVRAALDQCAELLKRAGSEKLAGNPLLHLFASRFYQRYMSKLTHNTAQRQSQCLPTT